MGSAASCTIVVPVKGTTDSKSRLQRALEAAERGALDEADAAVLFGARGDDLERLLVVASRLRDEGLERRGRPATITYSKKVFIPLTKLCRDRCHYCVFVETPGGLLRHGEPTYLSPEEILEIARGGAALGCKEALFTLGDRPEDRWPTARAWLSEHGYASTIDYLRAMAVLVLEETGLLPHLNPGVMSWNELQSLRPVAPSMGMMLETTATRLWSEPGGVHFGSPDKDPALRLRVLDDAGRSRIPFTTGVLLGIGENDAERAEALFAIKRSHELHGHVQEMIVQNFRAKPRTAMQNEADLALEEYVAAVAVARVVMGGDITVQAPPNLTDAAELHLLVRAGIDDWGGVSPLTADHVNPERPWPDLDELARLTASTGFRLRERLTAYPSYLQAADEWVDSRLMAHVDALLDPGSGLAEEGATVVGRPWNARIDEGFGIRSSGTDLIDRAAADPAGLSDSHYAELLALRGPALRELRLLADELRREAVGDAVTVVVNRNIDSSVFRADGAGAGLAAGELPVGALTTNSLSEHDLRELVEEAVTLGATEICAQGAIDPLEPADAYLRFARIVASVQPGLSLHAFRPVELLDGADRMGLPLADYLEALREAGVTSVPGTGARILDDRIRGILSEGADPAVATWIDIVRSAHRAGLNSTATMVYGHVETPVDQVAHLRLLASLQDETGGFTEFIPMPFVAAEAPSALRAVTRGGPTVDESRAVHAVARLLLHGRIDNIQAAWTKLGTRESQAVLTGGANDLGGLLIDGALRPTAGPEAFRSLTLTEVEQLAEQIGRRVEQRHTDYRVVERALR